MSGANLTPPRVPVEENEVGSYRRSFVVPCRVGGASGRHLPGGVKAFYYIWVNGELLGITKVPRRRPSGISPIKSISAAIMSWL